MPEVIERHLGGGKVFFSSWNGSEYATEVEIGEVQSLNLSIKTTTADATSKDTGLSKKVQKVPTGIDSSLKFVTQNVNKHNMAMAMLGEATTETFAIGDTLPDGTVATEQIIIPVIKGATQPVKEGRLRYVGNNIAGNDNPCLLVHHVSISPSGDVRDYFADKHSTLAFDGEVMEVVPGEYFKEYLIPKADA